MVRRLICIFLLSAAAFAQGARWDSVASTTKGIQGQTVTAPIPNPIITVCTAAATGIPCSPQVTTYTDSTLVTPCAGSTQVTLPGSSLCQSTGDSQGNYGFWVPAGNYTYSVSGAGVTAKLFSVTLPIIGGGPASVTTLTAVNINGDLWVGNGAGQYASMAACNTAATAGQTCHVTANWTETFTGNLVLKNKVCFQFHGLATIFLNAFQISAPSTVHACIRGPFSSATTNYVAFAYTGTGAALDFGDSTGDTDSDDLENFNIDIQSATNNSGVIGMRLRRIQDSIIQSVLVIGTSSSSNQLGFVLDGSGGGFTGDNTFNSIRTFQVGTGIQFLGNANINVFNGARVQARNIGLDFQQANGNIFFGDVENLPTGVNFSNSANNFGNQIYLYGQVNTTDVVFGAAACGNFVANVGAVAGTQITVTDPGACNDVWNPFTHHYDKAGNQFLSGMNLLGASNNISAAPPFAASTNTGWKSCIFGNSTCFGVGPSTWATVVGANNWFSIFTSGTYLAQDASSTAPDTNANASMGTDGTFRNSVKSRIAQAYVSGCNGTATANTTIDLSWLGSATPACTNTVTTLRVPVPSAGSLGNLRVRCNTGGVNASSGVFTVLKNNSASTITCTTGTGTTCNDVTHIVAVAAGDDLLVQFTSQLAETLANCAATFEKW